MTNLSLEDGQNLRHIPHMKTILRPGERGFGFLWQIRDRRPTWEVWVFKVRAALGICPVPTHSEKQQFRELSAEGPFVITVTMSQLSYGGCV